MTVAFTSILNEATNLYRQHGIRSTTMDEIAAQLGISKKTLYKHVETKQDLIKAVLDLDLRKRENEFRQKVEANTDIRVQFINLLDMMLQLLSGKSITAEYDLRKYYPEMNTYYKGKLTQTLLGLLKANIQHGKDTGMYRPDANADLLARLLVSCQYNLENAGLISNDELKQISFRKEYLITCLCSVLLNSIGEEVNEIIEDYFKPDKP